MTELLQLIDLRQLLITTSLGLTVYFAVFLAVLVDLWSGLRRSRRLGIQLKSKGLRSSLKKFNDYCLFILIASLIDMLLYAFTTHELIGISSVPWLTLIAGIASIGIEGWSIYENADKKRQQDIRIAIDNLATLAKTKGDASVILQHLASRMEQVNCSEEEKEEEPLTPDYPND